MKNSYACLLISLALLVVQPAWAQDKPAVEGKNSKIQLSGLAYVDYAYIVTSPDAEEEGENGFEYRRLYLTGDYTLSETFSGRARLEVKGGDGVPFVKDMYLKWKNLLGEGSEMVGGVSSPPVFTVSEGVWGYRSLEKTIMDRNKVASSRDFGVALKGRLTPSGSVKYAVMLANNNSTRGEDDKYKRIYGQLELYPTKQLTFTVGGDYAGGEDEDGFNANAFAGFKANRFRVGVEGFFNQISTKNAAAAAKQGAVQGEDSADLMGVSVFGAARVAEQLEVVARFDQVERDVFSEETSESFFLAGIAYMPHKKVRFIPNVLMSKESEDDDSFVAGRITLHVDF